MWKNSNTSGSERDLIANHRKNINNINTFVTDQHWNLSINLLSINRQSLQRIFQWKFLYELQSKNIGSVIELGVHYGATLSTLINLRGIVEPYNLQRKIIGIDTFEGFVSVGEKDKGTHDWVNGDYSVSGFNYEKHLEQVLSYHEMNCPLSHVKKFEILKGDAPFVLSKYLTENTHTIFSMVIFDMDVYQPTKECLLLIKKHCHANTIIVFDEINCSSFPGETLALTEECNILSSNLNKVDGCPYTTWAYAGQLFST